MTKLCLYIDLIKLILKVKLNYCHLLNHPRHGRLDIYIYVTVTIKAIKNIVDFNFKHYSDTTCTRTIL